MPDDAETPVRSETDAVSGSEASRLNLLLPSGPWQRCGVVEQLPRLLEPLGIRTIRVSTGEEAEDVIETTPIHVAVVDLAMPLSPNSTDKAACGTRLLQLLRRLESPPPMVLVRPPQAVARESSRGLSQALREGAFAVVDQPYALECMLEVMRRIIRRYYSNRWPA
ncbi:MAG: response regulator transcription factor [Phycisphaerales bacterium]|nr:response regulator transcription factor [Phycisphaerales bacterium]